MHEAMRNDLLSEVIETEEELANLEAELNETPPDIQPWWNLRAEVVELKTRLANLRLQLSNAGCDCEPGDYGCESCLIGRQA